MRYGLIAGSSRFPILALETARQLGHEVVVIALKGNAPAEVEQLGSKCYWITIAELGRLIEILHEERITEVVMAGQVKHTSLFSSLKPDWRLFKLLMSLPARNTDALIGGVQKVLEEEGIRLTDSTLLLKPLLAPEGVISARKPDEDEREDIDYGRRVGGALAGFDIGQSVAVSERACVAVEAMEGTDAMLRRAASLVNGRPLRLVKVSRRRKHLLFDVPVAGPGTIRTMAETGTTALAVDAGRTLLLDKDEMLSLAASRQISIIGYQPEEA
ncbi:MAG: UDP-2,3-diacylglucosamine diphosphatase LpxI [Candidatus Solibacter usitatus]|nr:UDP-2,3-diacylglucosamine diphosphatase LpxI [Candidatus Solibacter usitatus]